MGAGFVPTRGIVYAASSSQAVCTIIILSQVAAKLPLVVAANRDEMYARDATRPQVLMGEGGDVPRAIGGVDRAQGGTWMGANERGLFVGVTNQRTFLPPDRDLRSRGQVVLQALQRGSVNAVRRYLDDLDPLEYNPFNLLYGDGRRLEVAYARSGAEALVFETVGPGAHVLPNDRLDSHAFPKVKRARALLGSLDEVGLLSWAELRERLASALRDHWQPDANALEDPPSGSWLDKPMLARLQAMCIHTDDYGTRSATIVALEHGRVAHYLFAPGPPCTTAFEDVTALLR